MKNTWVLLRKLLKSICQFCVVVNGMASWVNTGQARYTNLHLLLSSSIGVWSFSPWPRDQGGARLQGYNHYAQGRGAHTTDRKKKLQKAAPFVCGPPSGALGGLIVRLPPVPRRRPSDSLTTSGSRPALSQCGLHPPAPPWVNWFDFTVYVTCMGRPAGTWTKWNRSFISKQVFRHVGVNL